MTPNITSTSSLKKIADKLKMDVVSSDFKTFKVQTRTERRNLLRILPFVRTLASWLYPTLKVLSTYKLLSQNVTFTWDHECMENISVIFCGICNVLLIDNFFIKTNLNHYI